MCNSLVLVNSSYVSEMKWAETAFFSKKNMCLIVSVCIPLQLAEKKREDIVLLASADRQAMELHMLTLVQDLAASLLMEFEKWVLRAESTGTILKTPLDSQSSLGSEEVYLQLNFFFLVIVLSGTY